MRFWGPEQSQALSASCLERIQITLSAIEELFAGRSQYLARNALNPAVFLPDHLWAQEHCQQNHARMASGDSSTIRNLRFFTGNFTGFSLLDMAPAAPRSGEAALVELPDNYAELVRKNAGNLKPVVGSFMSLTQGLPVSHVVKAPRLMGECGWNAGGIIINYDTWSLQQRINALLCSGALAHLEKAIQDNGRCRILEIGAGYGGLAYTLIMLLGKVEYIIVDLPESLSFSTAYLTGTLPNFPRRVYLPGGTLPSAKEGVLFVCNHLLEELRPHIGQVDLIINALSLSEMAPAQVDFYAKFIHDILGNKGVFFEQNYHEPGFHTNTGDILRSYLPYHRLLDETKAPHRGRGEVNLWANRYHGTIFDVGDILGLQDLLEILSPDPKR